MTFDRTRHFNDQVHCYNGLRNFQALGVTLYEGDDVITYTVVSDVTIVIIAATGRQRHAGGDDDHRSHTAFWSAATIRTTTGGNLGIGVVDEVEIFGSFVNGRLLVVRCNRCRSPYY